MKVEAAVRTMDGGAPTAFELVTRTRLEDLCAQVDRLESKVNALLVAAVAGVGLELVRVALR
jgi:hypothetical protein